MLDWAKMKTSRGALAAAAAVLVTLGAAGGAGAIEATRPSIEMAPMVRTPIARLAATSGVVTVKGRVAEVYGDRFVVQDASGRAMIAAGHEARGTVSVGEPVMVQGRFDDGQLRASYLVDRSGTVAAVGPRGAHPDGPDRPGRSAGPGRDGPPPPPPGCAPVPGGSNGPQIAPPPPPPPPVTGSAQGAGDAASPTGQPADRTPAPGAPRP